MFDRKNTLLSTVTTLFLIAAVIGALAQAPVPSNQQNSPPQSAPMGGDPTQILTRLEQESQAINQDLGRLRIDKWKADSATKRQTENNALSIQRNLNDALPGIIQQVRANPQTLAGNFKLYRNVTALYDVLVSLTESIGAFGGKSEYDIMAHHVAGVEDIRRSYADTLEAMAAHQDAQLAAARAAAATAAQNAAAAPPKQIVVDDTPAPAKKATRKKKPAQPASTTPKPPSQ
jgi:hypothetical protein